MAAQAGIWRAHKLKPHQVKDFKVSTDPLFAEKLRDVVGLYLDPPEKAIVFSVDEKSHILALDRTQPGLPMKPGKCGTVLILRRHLEKSIAIVILKIHKSLIFFVSGA